MDKIYVWLANTSQSKELAEQLYKYLTPEDLEESKIYYRPRQRLFFVGRALLRILITRHSILEQNQSLFRAQILPSTGRTNGVWYNMSHSNERIIFALSETRRIGVDIERIKSITNPEAYLLALGLDIQYETYKQMSFKNRQVLLFSLWTDLESYAKAKGEAALTHRKALKSSAYYYNHSRPRVIKLQKHQIIKLPVPAGYTSSLAVEGQASFTVEYKNVRPQDIVRLINSLGL